MTTAKFRMFPRFKIVNFEEKDRYHHQHYWKKLLPYVSLVSVYTFGRKFLLDNLSLASWWSRFKDCLHCPLLSVVSILILAFKRLSAEKILPLTVTYFLCFFACFNHLWKLFSVFDFWFLLLHELSAMVLYFMSWSATCSVEPFAI